MTIDKAVELLQLDHDDPGSVAIEDVGTAEQLAIEALKRIRGYRKQPPTDIWELLPGEDPPVASIRSIHHIKEVLESPLGREPRG